MWRDGLEPSGRGWRRVLSVGPKPRHPPHTTAPPTQSHPSTPTHPTRSAVIGEVDTAADAGINWDALTGQPLRPVVQAGM